MFLNESSHLYDHLPQYFRNIQIQPREDEGREALPGYSTTINFTNVLSRKIEYDNPVQRAVNRKWNRVLFSLQGTALNIYKSPRTFFGSKTSCPNTSLHLIRSYNLYHAQVGLAADYVKKKHVIRIRVETEQFLISCVKIKTLIELMQSLSAAIDLATPLDDRDYPQDFYMPRRQRRVRSTPMLTRERENRREVVTPVLNSRSFSRVPTSRSTSFSSSNSRCCSGRRSYSDLRSRFSSDEDESTLNFSIYSPQQASAAISHCSQSKKSPNNKNSDDKWQPFHQWSPIYDLMYAKRCFAVLTLCAPRKSNTIIVNGEFYVVDWVTGLMTKLCDVIPDDQKKIEIIPLSQNLKCNDTTELLPEYRELKEMKT